MQIEKKDSKNRASQQKIGRPYVDRALVGLQFTGKLFGFPKDIKEKMITSLEVGTIVLTKLCSSELNNYIIFPLEVRF